MNYQRVYNSIIDKAVSENRIKNKDAYYEAHHIIPKCLGGGGKEWQWKTHTNIVLLTAREHFLCHLLLCKIYPENIKIQYASWLMCTKRNKRSKEEYKISSKIYEILRIEHSKRVSENIKGRLHSDEAKLKMSNLRKGKPGLFAEKNGMYGKHHTDDWKKRNGEFHKNRIISIEEKESKRLAGLKRRNVPLTEEHKKKVSENHANVSGSKNPMYGKPSPRRISYIDINTGVIHIHKKAAAEYYKLSMRKIITMIKKGVLLKI